MIRVQPTEIVPNIKWVEDKFRTRWTLYDTLDLLALHFQNSLFQLLNQLQDHFVLFNDVKTDLTTYVYSEQFQVYLFENIPSFDFYCL